LAITNTYKLWNEVIMGHGCWTQSYHQYKVKVPSFLGWIPSYEVKSLMEFLRITRHNNWWGDVSSQS
jgi:hypothetical protein